MFGRIFSIAIASACLAIPATAQTAKPQGKQEKRELKHEKGADVRKFQKALNLTDEQTNQVRTLLAERDRQLGTSKGKDRKSAQSEFQSKLRAILTPDQAKIFDDRMGKKGKQK
jgi:Spy/CpxP family protein refolding chaperone